MMDTTSNKPMSRHNRMRALVRITKELKYIANKSEIEFWQHRELQSAIESLIKIIRVSSK